MLGTRLGIAHFAHLRAVAQGIDLVSAARRYLGIEHAAQSRLAHREVVERVRAVARRRGDRRWRLIGLQLPPENAGDVQDLHEWAAAEGLDGWSERELQDLFAERTGASDPAQVRRVARNARLRTMRLDLLRELEQVAAEHASTTDLIAGWFDPHLAGVLQRGGLLTLGDLQAHIGRGGKWWRSFAAIGPTKAGRLERYLCDLVGPAPAWPVVRATGDLAKLSGAQGANRVPATTVASIDARDDSAAVLAWVQAKATSGHTQVQYQREAERFILWCVVERGRALSDATAEDCRGYMDFLANIPAHWISRKNVPRMAPGWAPFRGQLSVPSQQLAITIVSSLFTWLVAARYLVANPWVLVNRKLGDAPVQDAAVGFESRAFTSSAWQALQAELRRGEGSAANDRLKWLCAFVSATGLRAAELVGATRGHLQATPKGTLIRVHGKGRRNRFVPVPSGAVEATQLYLAQRGLDFDRCDPSTPLLASLSDATAPITYEALYQTFTRFVQRAMRRSQLPDAERQLAARASTHWLRHTYATRCAEGGMDIDVLQSNLGQSDPRTTAGYFRAQIERRQEQAEKVFNQN